MSDPLFEVLRLCAEAAPLPLYPRSVALPSHLTRQELDDALERLRRHGLVTLTEWEVDHGQGYVLTPAGARALREPTQVVRLDAPAPRRRADTDESDLLTRRPRTRADDIREALLSGATPAVTYTLLAINIAIFLLDATGVRILGQFPNRLLRLESADLAVGGWHWLRLLTCCFVHADQIHIFMNMIGLYSVGPLLERMWGRSRFLALYLLSGLGGSCTAAAMMLLRPRGLAPEALVGASGALWGCMGALGIWIVLNRRYLPPQLFRSWGANLLVILGINIVISFLPGISAAAHFGGGAVGAVCAALLHLERYGSRITRVAALTVLTALPALLVGPLVLYRERAPGWARLQQKAQAERADRAIDELNEVLPKVQEDEKAARAAYDRHEVGELVQKHPQRRDPDDVTGAIAAIDTGLTHLQGAVTRLEQVGPYDSPPAEKARQLRLDLLRARIDLFSYSRDILQKGRNVTGDVATQLGKREERVRTLERAYRPLLRD